MQHQQIILPLDIPEGEARLSWAGSYYFVSAALALPGRAETPADVEDVMNGALLVFKLVPFRDKLRARMLSLLAEDTGDGDHDAEPAPGPTTVAALASQTGAKPAWGVVAEFSIRDGRVRGLQDIRKALPTPGAAPGKEFDPTSAHSVELEDQDRTSLTAALQTYIDKALLTYVREPFASFAPELVALGGWKDRAHAGRKDDTLVPYQTLFINAFPIDLEVAGTEYFLDDLYCTQPSCSCVDVTCIILRHDPASQQNVAHAGFKYNVETGKTKAMSEFPGKLNVAEWLKRFSQAHPIDLEAVLASRYRFMRGEFIRARKESQGHLKGVQGPLSWPQGLK